MAHSWSPRAGYIHPYSPNLRWRLGRRRLDLGSLSGRRHLARFAAPLADRFMVMEHGRVIQQFSQAELPARMARLHEYLGV